MTPAPPLRAIVTGASGFVGRSLLARAGPDAVAVSLGADDWRGRIAAASWRDACVYHLAARVHRHDEGEAFYERDNVEKTIALGEAAAHGGARRLVFLSTIKVHGDETRERPFQSTDTPAPEDAYARSKWKAEEALRAISARTGLPTVVVRSPLVIGPGASGNLRALLRLAKGPWPLPFGALDNRRTFVALDDLVRLLETCASSPEAASGLFLAGDPRPMSTANLVVAMRAAWGRSPGLFRVGAPTLEAMAALVGRAAKARRLTRSLEVDVSETMRRLAWAPSTPMDAAIARMSLAYVGGDTGP